MRLFKRNNKTAPVADAQADINYYSDSYMDKESSTPPETKWICGVCGYEYKGDRVPVDFICPICSATEEAFYLE